MYTLTQEWVERAMTEQHNTRQGIKIHQ